MNDFSDCFHFCIFCSTFQQSKACAAVIKEDYVLVNDIEKNPLKYSFDIIHIVHVDEYVVLDL